MSPGVPVVNTIKATCPACDGDITLVPAAVTLARYDTGPRYAFRCPRCKAQCSKPADAETVRLLSLAGLHPDLRIPNPTVNGESPSGPLLTTTDLHDLLIDLHIDPDPVAELR